MLDLRSRIDAALAWALLASTAVVTTLLVAGAVLGDLSAWLVVTLNAAVAGLLGLLSLARRRNSPRRRPWREVRLHGVLADLRADPWLLALVAIATAEVLWRLVIAYVMPPYANDALWYHLTTVAGWLQAHRIGPSTLSIWSTVYPHNGELLFTWPALLLGNDTFVDAVQLPFAVVAALAVTGLGRTAGLSRRGAAAAGCLFFLAPVVLSQTTANYTDLIFIAFFLAAFHFLLRFLADLRAPTGGGRLAHVFLAGLACGLALGTKDLGVVYVPVLSLLLAAHLLTQLGVRRATRLSVAGTVLVFALPLLALGSYHYVETWIRFGNPIYPVRLAPFGVELFAGRPVDLFLTQPETPGPWWREVWGQWRRDFFFLAEPRFHAYSYDDRHSGLGPLWSYLALLLLPAFVIRLARSDRAMLLNLVLPILVMFALQPYRWWSRFTMILIALGVVAIVAVVEAVPHRWATGLKVFALGLVALGIGFPTLKVDGEYWASRIVTLARVPAEERTIGRVALPGYRWLDERPRRARIGLDTSAAFLGGQPYIVAYPLFGAALERRVYPLPRGGPAAVERLIGEERISYVFVHRDGPFDRSMDAAVRAGCARPIYDGLVFNGKFGRAYRVAWDCDWIRTHPEASRSRGSRPASRIAPSRSPSGRPVSRGLRSSRAAGRSRGRSAGPAVRDRRRATQLARGPRAAGAVPDLSSTNVTRIR